MYRVDWVVLVTLVVLCCQPLKVGLVTNPHIVIFYKLMISSFFWIVDGMSETQQKLSII